MKSWIHACMTLNIIHLLGSLLGDALEFSFASLYFMNHHSYHVTENLMINFVVDNNLVHNRYYNHNAESVAYLDLLLWYYRCRLCCFLFSLIFIFCSCIYPKFAHCDVCIHLLAVVIYGFKEKFLFCQDTHNQAGIAHNGGLVPLLKLLDSKNGSLQHNAAFALYGLADNEVYVFIDFIQKEFI